MGHSPLCIGLGGFGGSVLRHLPPEGRDRRLWIDQRYQVARHSTGIHAVPLASPEAREALLHLGSWHQTCPWLPDGDSVRLLGELGPTSAAGLRAVGRLSLARSRRLLDAGLRRIIGQASGHHPAPGEVFIITSCGGGTGSGILFDVTTLLRRLLPESVFYLLLALPPAGLPDMARVDASAYATLREIAIIYQGHPFQPSLEGTIPLDPKDLKDELWQRIFLFAATDGPPYPKTVQEASAALLLLLDDELREWRREELSALARPDDHSARTRIFSCCGGFFFGSSPHKNYENLGPPDLESRTSNKQPEPGECKSAAAFTPEHRKRIEDVLDRLYEAIRSLRGPELVPVDTELRRIEGDIIKTIEDLNPGKGICQERLEELKEYHSEVDWTLVYPQGSRFPRFRFWWKSSPVRRNFTLRERINLARKLLELSDREFKSITSSKETPFMGAHEGRRDLKAIGTEKEGIGAETSFQGIFCRNQPPGENRFAVIGLLPRDLPNSTRSALEHYLQQFPCAARLQTTETPLLRLYFEDLFHTIEEIRFLGDYKAAYDTYPYRELLHTDRTFLRT